MALLEIVSKQKTQPWSSSVVTRRYKMMIGISASL